MKTEDFERLKNLIDSEGWEVIDTSTNTSFSFEVQKKDIWDGVEFIERFDGEDLWVRKVKQPILSKHKAIEFIKLTDDDQLDASGFAYKHGVKSSTESAYIEQLKKIAFEKFGEIKEGDRFDESTIDGYYFKGRIVDTVEFHYYKEVDILCVGEVTLYRKGKWAEKLPERVKVQVLTWNYENGDYYSDKFSITFLSKNLRERNYEKIGKYIANKLETYLNDTNNNQD